MSQEKINNSDRFDEFLIEFQQDIKKIVGKFKKNFHALSDDEVYSECNLHLLKNKDRILESFSGEKDFTESEFKKIAYHYVKNETVWSHYRVAKKAYFARRTDGVIETDEGSKSYFESIIDTHGEENKEIDNDKLFFGFNSKQFLRMLIKYSYLLNEQELRIISYIQLGLNLNQIAEKFDITHQAISFCFVNIQKKLKSHFNFNDVLNGGSAEAINKGSSNISSFFKKRRSIDMVSEADRIKIRDFIINNPKLYTGKEINKKLFGNKYYMPKIWGTIRSLKLSNFIKKN